MHLQMKKIKSPIILTAVVLAAWVGYKQAYPSGTWRYKMTVEVETPEGIKTGYAVREATVVTGPKLWSEGSSHVEFKGEAVTVDLGARGVLFALLGTDDYNVVFNAFPSPKPARTPDGVRYYSHLKNARTELPIGLYPRFVRFRDINDPKTVEKLIEMKACDGTHGFPVKWCIKEDHFEEAFGKGVRVKSVTIEMTDEEVTWGIQKYLTWLSGYYNKMFDGQRYNTIKAELPLANSLSSGAFSTGEKK